MCETPLCALESGQLAGYVGDVWFPQPAPNDHPWRSMPHHGMTPHISGTSLSAQSRYAAGTREILECFFSGRPIRDEYLIVAGGALADFITLRRGGRDGRVWRTPPALLAKNRKGAAGLLRMRRRQTCPVPNKPPPVTRTQHDGPVSTTLVGKVSEIRQRRRPDRFAGANIEAAIVLRALNHLTHDEPVAQ